MKKYLFILLIISLLIIIACDRFEHKFEPDVQTENCIIEFFNTFADSIATFPANIPGIMTLYHDDYSNNGTTKQDMEDFYTSFTLINTPITLSATLIDTTLNNEIEWRLIATELSGTVFMDTTFTDVLLPTGDSFLFYGNQADMKNIVVELFTGQWCTYCPNAEDALHNLKIQYGSRISYVEYHFNDYLASNTSPITYYPVTGFPFCIVNGNALSFVGAETVEEAQDNIENAMIPLLQEQPLISLSDLQAAVTDTLLTGSIKIELDTSLTSYNLKLVAVLLDDSNDQYLNHHGDPHLNIALHRTTLDISSHDLSEPVTFEIQNLDDLPVWYINNNAGLPDDLSLVIWIQFLEDEYNQDTCTIYNVIQVSL
ncbi:MAG: hypothetical protein DRH79_05785 [Candidatus Cloacimonadota bacterium]|nr:MAG: hypothetical protein DRH79_05785 [Candidatus Cloacimonadota bacterium]